MKKFIFFIFIIISNIVYSKTTSTNGSGYDWNTSTIWSNGVPSSNNDYIIISENDSVRADLDRVVGSTGTLIIKSGAILVVNNITFRNGSNIIVENGGALYVINNLTNNNNSNDILINGNLYVGGTLSNGVNSAIFGDGVVESENYSGSCCIMGHDPDVLTPGVIINDSVVLPIVLKDFSIKMTNDDVLIEWITLFEINNDYFIIEKSKNIKDWLIVSVIYGFGNSNQEIKYQYYDKFEKGFIYYRIKQFDYDGKSETFYIKSLNKFDFEKNDIKLENNILKSGECISICCFDIHSIQILDIFGNVIKYIKNDNKFVLNKPGIYILIINNNIKIKIIVI